MPPVAVVKRFLDIGLSGLGIVLLSPLMLLIGLAVKLQDGGPILYNGERLGKAGTRFRLHKFRTMIVDADRQGPGITSAGDRRITRLGAVLRRFKLDELPQLFNVIKGEMSLVGPRPEDPRYLIHYSDEQRRTLAVRPGITGIASLVYRQEEKLLTGPEWEQLYCQKLLPAKLDLELAYLQKRTVWSDMGLVLRTLFSLFKGPTIANEQEKHLDAF